MYPDSFVPGGRPTKRPWPKRTREGRHAQREERHSEHSREKGRHRMLFQLAPAFVPAMQVGVASTRLTWSGIFTAVLATLFIRDAQAAAAAYAARR